MQDLKTLSAATLTEMFNEAFGKAVKVGTYPKSKMIEDLTALAAQASGLYIDEEEAAVNKPEVDPMRPQDGWPIQEVTSEPVDLVRFFEIPGGVGYPAPAPLTDEEALVKERLAAKECPFCGSDPTSQTAAGEEGTFLGDSCNLCHGCNKSYNAFTGVEVPTRDTKKRRILNPQGKIDAKEAALLEAGFGLTYDRHTRIWTVGSNRADEKALWNMTSKQFSAYSPKEMVAHAEERIRAQA